MLARILVMLVLCASVQVRVEAGDDKPWPSDVPGWVAVEPGEHPRLFFRQVDLPALRKRASTPEGKAILKRLRTLLDGANGQTLPPHKNPVTTAYGKSGGPKPGEKEMPVGTYSMSHAAGYGLLYQLTGEERYAELGGECFEWALEGLRDRDREGRYSLKDPGGALRAGPSLGWYAVGYDLCCGGWPAEYRRRIAAFLCSYDEGENRSLEELARGSRHMPASNHWGMQVGGAALALLAIRGDPGTDAAKVEALLEVNQKAMIRNLTEGFGDHGWFPEGDGTGSMSSHIAFVSALNAWKVAGGKDFISPRPNAPWMTLKWIFLTVPRNGRMDFPKRGAYPHNVWAREGLSGAGYLAQGYGAVTQAQKGALLWFYNRHLKELDEKAGAPFDTISVYPHNSVCAFINWPFGMEESNPAEVLPQAVRDEIYGFYMFRNRWQDEKDTVISLQTRNTRGWHKANTDGRLQVWSLGRKMKWGRLRTDITYFQPASDGSAILTGKDGTTLAIDFSRASGAEAMLVMTGPGAPKENTVKAGNTTFSFLFLTEGETPVPEVRGDHVVAGKQTVSLEDGNLVLEKMAGR